MKLGYLWLLGRRRQHNSHVITLRIHCAQERGKFDEVCSIFAMVFFETCGPNEAMVVSGISPNIFVINVTFSFIKSLSNEFELELHFRRCFLL